MSDIDEKITMLNKAVERLAWFAMVRLKGREVVYGPDDSAYDTLAYMMDMPALQIRDMVWKRLGMLLKGEA